MGAVVVGYLANGWLLKPMTDSAFVHGHLNDVLAGACILALADAVTPLMSRRARTHLAAREHIGILIAAAVYWEAVAPHLTGGTGDPWDVLAYAGGALLYSATAACLTTDARALSH